MAVVHPLESRMHQTKARAKKILCIVWILPCFVASPFLYPAEAFANTLQSHYGTISRLTCFINLPESFRKGYYTFLFVFIYILPLSFIGGTCLQVARCLLKGIPVHRQGSIRRQEANRRKVAKMVLMVIFAFAVAWTPYFLVSIVTQYAAVNFMERENFFFTMLNINLFAFLNSCVNPFIYAAMSTRFRNGFLRCFRFICMVDLCSGGVEEAPLDQIAAERGRGKKTVRFRCQPMSCVIAQSSSDGCSNAASDTSQRTAYTVDVHNTRRGGSIFRVFSRKRPGQKFIAHYIKNRDKINFDNIPRQENRLPEANCSLENRLNALTERVRNLPSKTNLDRKNSSSTGDVSSLANLNASITEDTPLCNRKWSSCLAMSNQ